MRLSNLSYASRRFVKDDNVHSDIDPVPSSVDIDRLKRYYRIVKINIYALYALVLSGIAFLLLK